AEAAAQDAKAQSVAVDTIAFGTSGGVVTVQGQDVPVPYDPDAMAQIAADSGGQSFTAQTADQPAPSYDRIGRDVAYVVTARDLPAAFAGAALVVALLAAAGALLWTQRLV